MDTDILGNQLQHGRRYSRDIGSSVIPNPKVKDIGSGVDTESQKFGSNVDADILRNRFQRGYRYSRKSAPTWMPIFQEIGSNVNADIPGISGYRFWRGYRIPLGNSSDLDTESHWESVLPFPQGYRFQRGYRIPLGNSSDLDTESHWESVLPFPQKISSGVDTNIPGFPFRFYQIGLGENYGWIMDGGW
ncbi:unnamed protein product [Rhizophagus irregularis]|nr:unnamed protein product [Rhizophagus irregularis]